MGGSAVSFQTPTALYSSIAGQPGYGTLFPAAGLGWPGTANTGPASPFYRALEGINNLSSYGSNNNAALQGLTNAGSSALTSGQNTYNQLSPYVGQALQQGFDPQGQLFNRLFQQQQDQSQAVNAMSGVATTPYGAALTQQGNQNFDLAWQQQQLANQAQGANTASTLAGAGMGALGSGINSAVQGISTPLNASQQQISDYLNYIMSNVNEGSAIANATNSATNAGAASTNSLVGAQQAANSGKGGIGSALSGIGSLVGSFI